MKCHEGEMKGYKMNQKRAQIGSEENIFFIVILVCYERNDEFWNLTLNLQSNLCSCKVQ